MYQDPTLMYGVGMTFMRILMIVIATGAGFAIGWLFSPKSKGFRRKAMIVFAVLLVLATLFLNNIIGWNAAGILAWVGFIAAIAYWHRDWLERFQGVPTTFGSSRWATKDDLKDHNVYGNHGIRIGTAFNHDNQAETISYKGDGHLLTCPYSGYLRQKVA